ncbi:uncharacterized protein LOC113049962 [Carassius auratus]|uniref:Uncharacterized protein LOC113049962 n=1 Tax=Carassius auratus TaxID=7957 RepID=A0A6P6K9B2_CARAU|nr:uncharacterized protein LOC113049962 [Carassius auratus]
MESSKLMSTDKATVIIQVNPQVKQNNVICDDEQQARVAYHNTALKGFFKAQPKALGTVQIMIGVVIFLVGIAYTSSDNTYEIPVVIFSGITYWGSLIYISAGSLSVAAQNKLHLCVVKASLGMNVISSITAVIAIILMSIEILISPPYRRRIPNFNMWITGILLVFSILQFIISILISGFACKATCNTDSTVVNVALNQLGFSRSSIKTEFYLDLNAENYQLHQSKILFLIFNISQHGIFMYKRKVDPIHNWPTPTTVKELQFFLRFANFDRCFIFSPLTSLFPGKPKSQSWSSAATEAFEKLKQAFITTPLSPS